jgi:hypothetical protein
MSRQHVITVCLIGERGRLITSHPFHAETYLGDALTELLFLSRETELIDYDFDVNYKDVCVVGGRRHCRQRREDCFKLSALPLYQFPMINHSLRLYAIESYKTFGQKYLCRNDTLHSLLAWNLQCSQKIYDGLVQLICTRAVQRFKTGLYYKRHRRFLDNYSVRFIFIRWGKTCTFLSKGRFRVFVILPSDVNRFIASLLFQLWIGPMLQFMRNDSNVTTEIV